jgi:hypothetical protein
VIIDLFEVIEPSNITMALRLQELLDKFVLTEKVVAYVKDERSNLQTYASALNVIMSCLGLL